jgi:predicted tellurium resistance membrane protein TerC
VRFEALGTIDDAELAAADAAAKPDEGEDEADVEGEAAEHVQHEGNWLHRHTVGRLGPFWATVVAVEIMDLAFSLDNVFAAVAFTKNKQLFPPPSDMILVCIGVFIGILALRFVAGLCIKLIERFPILESTSFVLIGYVGGLLLTELITHVHIGPLGKFVGIVIILALAIMYAEIGAFQKVARPVLKIFVPLMRLVDFIVGGVFQLIFWPFKKAWSLVRR